MSALILLNLRLSDWAYTGSLIGGQAEAALRSCSKSDEDTYCGNFCRRVESLIGGQAEALAASYQWAGWQS